MKLHEIMGRWLRLPRPGWRAPRRRGLRLRLEQLEDRTVPSNFTAASVSDLIADINAANQTPEADTIVLAPSTTFKLSEINNVTDGANGLPVIVSGEDLTIVGNGDVIERKTAGGTPAFRLFDLAVGAVLTVKYATLQGGLALGSGVSAQGGAVYNQGSLNLDSVIIQHNTAQGSDALNGYGQGQSAAGGGIYSKTSLTLQGCTVQNNQAVGGHAGQLFYYGQRGGDALGGGLYVASGTVTIDNTTLAANSAQGGDGGDGVPARFGHPAGRGGDGGAGFGGGLFAAGGTLSLRNSSVTMNVAHGGSGGKGGSSQPNGTIGPGIGGGIYIVSTASVGLDAFTVNHVTKNHASTSDDNIFGSYDLIV